METSCANCDILINDEDTLETCVRCDQDFCLDCIAEHQEYCLSYNSSGCAFDDPYISNDFE